MLSLYHHFNPGHKNWPLQSKRLLSDVQCGKEHVDLSRGNILKRNLRHCSKFIYYSSSLLCVTHSHI